MKTVCIDNFVGGHLKDKAAGSDKSCEQQGNQQWFSMKFCSLLQTPTTRCCTWQFKSCSKQGSFSCFVCVHVFMSFMWFFYPRASSGTLSQESKCGTPVTASSSPHMPFVYVRACMCMCAHRFIYRVTHEPLRLCTFMYAWVCSSWHRLYMLVAQKISPQSPGLLLGKMRIQ